MTRRQSKDPLERYDTPAWVTRALLSVAGPTLSHMRVIEPMAGAGAMTRVLVDEAHCRVQSFDIEPRAAGIGRDDSLTPGFWSRPDLGLAEHARSTAVVTNPCFSRAADVVRLAIASGVGIVAIVARLSFLEACDGRDDLPDPDGLIVVPRPSFTGGGSDSVTVAWFVWHHPDLRAHRAVRGIYRLTRKDKAQLEREPFVPVCGGCPVTMAGVGAC